MYAASSSITVVVVSFRTYAAGTFFRATLLWLRLQLFRWYPVALYGAPASSVLMFFEISLRKRERNIDTVIRIFSILLVVMEN